MRISLGEKKDFYIAGLGYGFWVGFGFQIKWLHCIMQNISHYMDSDWDPTPISVKDGYLSLSLYPSPSPTI